MYISNGKYYKYKGSRTIEDFKNFVSEGYKNAEDQGPIPQPPSWFEQFMDTLKEAMIEVYEALDPILNQIGFKHVPGFVKVGLLLSIVLLPAITIVGCIFWCENRQLKKYEQGAQEEPDNDD